MKEVVKLIMLTSIKGKEFYLNSDLIYKITEAPDTIITLTDGKVLRVEEKGEEIRECIIRFKREIYASPMEG